MEDNPMMDAMFKQNPEMKEYMTDPEILKLMTNPTAMTRAIREKERQKKRAGKHKKSEPK